MKTIRVVITILLLLLSNRLLLSQTDTSTEHHSNKQIIAGILNLQEQRIIDIAEAMPGERYSFAPTRGEFKGVRTFAEQLKHIAADNYGLGAAILGEKPPNDIGPDENGSKAVHTKAETIAYVKASFAYMHRAAAAIDDTNTTIPTPWPPGTATRLGLAIEDCMHTWDHHGQLVEYLRMNGIVPPASR